METRELMVTKGNYHYLVDMESNKGFSFTEFGQSVDSVNARYAISLGGVVRDVDILSILSDSTMSICEVYLRGERIVVPGNGTSLYSKLSKALPKITYIPFRITRPDMVGLVQILLPLSKGACSIEDVKGCLGA